MIDLTKEIIIDKISKYINRIILDVPHIDSIIFAGTVSSNNYIISLIKENISDYNLKFYLCTFPSVAVVKGAILSLYISFSCCCKRCCNIWPKSFYYKKKNF